jgi:hypothetical protein
MTGIYLEIGPWKFNPVSGPTRQIVKARSMPNTAGFQPANGRRKSVPSSRRDPSLVQATVYCDMRLAVLRIRSPLLGEVVCHSYNLRYLTPRPLLDGPFVRSFVISLIGGDVSRQQRHENEGEQTAERIHLFCHQYSLLSPRLIFWVRSYKIPSWCNAPKNWRSVTSTCPSAFLPSAHSQASGIPRPPNPPSP